MEASLRIWGPSPRAGSEDGEASPQGHRHGRGNAYGPCGESVLLLVFPLFLCTKRTRARCKKKKLSFCTSKFFYVKSDLALFWLFQRKGTQESQEHTQSILQWEMHAIEKAGQQDTNSFAARGKLSLGLAECG